jgi:NADPH2:quinone reductase
MATMNAVQVHKLGGPEVLEYSTNVPRPKPGPDDVLVQIKAVGVNPVDVLIRTGTFPPKQFPYIPGADFAGIVAEVGSNVTDLKVGQRVYGSDLTAYDGMNAYAQFIAIKHNLAHPLHDNLTFSQGASLPIPYFTAYRALYHIAQAKPGETVFVHGASGGVGIAVVQISSGLGLTVIGTASTPEGRELAKKAGAHFIFNHYEEGYLEKVKEAAGEKGIDLIIESIADKNLKKDISLIRNKGRIIVVGGVTDIAISPLDVFVHEVIMKGVIVYSITNEEMFETREALYAGAKAGWLNPFIWKEFPLEKAADAQVLLKSGSGARGKIILTVN